MENKLILFNNEEFGQIRAVYIEGKEYFIAKDVANALGYSNPRDAINRHCKGVVKNDSFKDSGNAISLISEGDVYRLIIKSKLPSAEKFEKWVFEEVLPSIRKHGAYIDSKTIENMIASPEFGIKLLTTLQEEKTRRIEAENKLEEQKPKMDLYDAVMNDDGLMNFIQVASTFGDCGRNSLMKLLRECKILMDGEFTRNIPYSNYLGEDGYFEVKVRPRKTKDGMKEIATTLCKPSALPLIKKVLDKKKDNNLLEEAN